MTGKPTTGFHYERIDHGWKRQVENGTEFHYDAELVPIDPDRTIDKLFEMGTDQCGVMRLERWPQGIVFWYHGQIVWRSWQAPR